MPKLISFARRTIAVTFILASSVSLAAQSLINLGYNHNLKGLNDQGQLVGSGNYSVSAVRLTPDGAAGYLGLYVGNQSSGFGINDAGEFTGSNRFQNPTNPFILEQATAFIYSSGGVQSLGTLGGTRSTGYAINVSGQVVGESLTASNRTHAFFYSDGMMHDLGGMGAGDFSIARDLNDAGQVVGYFRTANSPPAGVQSHAFLWEAGNWSDLGTLGGPSSFAYAINNLGHITGTAQSEDGFSHAFIYRDGLMQDLGLFGGIYSSGTDLNDHGQIVGNVVKMDVPFNSQAFLYENGEMHALNTLYSSLLSDGSTPGFVSLTHATSINSHGQILGQGLHTDGSLSWFLLDAGETRAPSVPETGNMTTILGIVFLALVCARNRVGRRRV